MNPEPHPTPQQQPRINPHTLLDGIIEDLTKNLERLKEARHGPVSKNETAS